MWLGRVFANRDVLVGSILLGLAVWYGLESGNFPEGRAGDPGPGVFPLILSVLLFLLSMWLIIASQLTRRKAEPGEDTADETDEASTSGYGGLLRAACAAVLTIVYISLFTTLGYVISTALYAVSVSFLFRPRRIVFPFIAAFLSVGALYLLFVVFLNVRLPLGLLG